MKKELYELYRSLKEEQAQLEREGYTKSGVGLTFQEHARLNGELPVAIEVVQELLGVVKEETPSFDVMEHLRKHKAKYVAAIMPFAVLAIGDVLNDVAGTDIGTLDASGAMAAFTIDNQGIKGGEFYINPTNNLTVGGDTQLSGEGGWNYWLSARIGRNENAVVDYLVPKRMSIHGDMGKRGARAEIMMKNPMRIGTEQIGTDGTLGRVIDAVVPTEIGNNMSLRDGAEPMHRLGIRNSLRSMKIRNDSALVKVINDLIPNTIDNRIGEDFNGDTRLLRTTATFGTNGVREAIRQVPLVGDAIADNAPNRVSVIRSDNGTSTTLQLKLEKDF
jgi:hypothetical protein